MSVTMAAVEELAEKKNRQTMRKSAIRGPKQKGFKLINHALSAREMEALKTDGSRRPPFSYATLIADAILNAPNKKLTLGGIYEHISSRFAYFRQGSGAWQVRHETSHYEMSLVPFRTRSAITCR